MSTPTPKNDDLEAVRTISTTLDPFKADERERILRWVRERLGMASAPSVGVSSPPPAHERPPQALTTTSDPSSIPTGGAAVGTDIRSFVESKAPRSQNELAVVVAYYYRLVAPEGQRKESITKEDLVEACRMVKRHVPEKPAQVLVNTHGMGLLDRTAVRGAYELNAVGENLVAMTLPTADGKGALRKQGSKRVRQAKKPKAAGRRGKK